MKIPQLETLQRYNIPTPRYTSYPTALAFDEAVDGGTVAGRLAEQDNRDRSVSIYFHLPFCRALCWYCACTKVITKEQGASADYLDTVLREFDSRLPWFEDQEVVQLHLGGGTPTFFLADELRKLGKHVAANTKAGANAEWSVEIDPREINEEQIDALVDAGFNRASLGVQDHDEGVQETIHRKQPFELTQNAVKWLRERGINGINMDLIYGLPGQSPDSFARTIDDVLSLEPDRLAIYSYAHVPWAAPAQKHLERAGLPDVETKLSLFTQAVGRLGEAGYTFIGMDHFAKPDDELSLALADETLHRNFQGYSTRAGTDIHGFGMSAISQTRDMYFQNAKELPAWEASIKADSLPIIRGIVLTEDDRIRRKVIMSIMCSAHLDFARLSKELGVNFAEYFKVELESLGEFENAGFVTRTADQVAITEAGRFFVRNIARVFDASKPNKTSYSRAI